MHHTEAGAERVGPMLHQGLQRPHDNVRPAERNSPRELPGLRHKQSLKLIQVGPQTQKGFRLQILVLELTELM